MNRRTLLGLSAAPLMTSIARAAESVEVPLEAATARNVIYLYMAGGMTHLDTLDVKPAEETKSS